jgi:hypothetical protein
MIIYGELEKNGKEAVMAFFKVLFQPPPGETEKNSRTS